MQFIPWLEIKKHNPKKNLKKQQFVSKTLHQIIWRFFTENRNTPPKFNIAPEKLLLEDMPFLLGFGNFSGANC